MNEPAQSDTAGPARVRLFAFVRPFHGHEGLLAVPALVGLVLAGMIWDERVHAMVAAGAAFSVGLGTAHTMGRWRWDSMVAALAGMILAGFAGTLIGLVGWAYVAFASGFAGLTAWLALRDTQVWWTVLQFEVGFLVAGHFAGGVGAALDRAGLILLGGALQIACVVAFTRIFPAVREAYAGGSAEPETDSRLIAAHVARAVVCVGASLLTAQALGLAYAYWAPLAALLVLKPRLHETRARGVQRLGGTLCGCLLATLFAMACHDAPLALVAGMAVSAWCAFSAQKAHYVLLTTAITVTVVLMVSLAGTDPAANAEHRLLATLLGGVIALVVAALVPHKLPRAAAIRMDRIGRPPAPRG